MVKNITEVLDGLQSQGINEYITTSGTYQRTYDLAGQSDIVYRLNKEHFEYNETFDRWDEHSWDPLFNYNESPTTAEIFSVALKIQPQVLHRYHPTVSGTLESEVVVTVLDQFRTPVFNKTVMLSSDLGGTIAPTQANTDTNGQIRATYTANSVIGDITVTAEVIP